MIKFEIKCDECRKYLNDGEEVYCQKCVEEIQKDSLTGIEELKKKIEKFETDRRNELEGMEEAK